MRKWMLIIGLALVGLLATPHPTLFAEDDGGIVPPPPPDLDDADDEAATTTPATTPNVQDLLAEGNGKPGKITAARVHVRAGPSTDFEILKVLNRDTRLVIFSNFKGWYKISYPVGHPCYVHQRYVKGNIPADIPEAGVTRSIIGDKVRLRVRPWNRSTAVGFVNKGTRVTIIEIRGEWLKIIAPRSARAWVSAKYARLDSDDTRINVPDTVGTPPPTTGRGTPSSMQKDYQKILQALKKREEARLTARQNRFDDSVQSLDDQLTAIDAETKAAQKRRSNVRSTHAQEGPGSLADPGTTGWVEYIGRAFKRPADFRLVKGGEVLFLMRSSKIDLARFVNRRVIVDGAVELAPGFPANVLIVDTIRTLTEPPNSVATTVKVRHRYYPPKEPVTPKPAPQTPKRRRLKRGGSTPPPLPPAPAPKLDQKPAPLPPAPMPTPEEIVPPVDIVPVVPTEKAQAKEKHPSSGALHNDSPPAIDDAVKIPDMN